MHSIRLRGPWGLYLPGNEVPTRVEMPATWQSLLAHGPLPSPARLLRRFGLPTGITPTDRLHLVIESAATTCQVELNGQLLGNIEPSQQSSSWQVTKLLLARNELVLVLAIPPREFAPPESSCPVNDVRLEIVGV